MLSYKQAIDQLTITFDYERQHEQASVLALVYEKSFKTVWKDMLKAGNIHEYTVKMVPISDVIKDSMKALKL